MWVKGEEGAKDDYFDFDLNRLDSEVTGRGQKEQVRSFGYHSSSLDHECALLSTRH